MLNRRNNCKAEYKQDYSAQAALNLLFNKSKTLE
jgi:hypothetical protein